MDIDELLHVVHERFSPEQINQSIKVITEMSDLQLKIRRKKKLTGGIECWS